jgi:hypothetical protein
VVLLLSEPDVAGMLSIRDGIRVLEQALADHAAGVGAAMPRISADVPGNGGAFRIMSAIVPHLGVFGLNTPRNIQGAGFPAKRTSSCCCSAAARSRLSASVNHPVSRRRAQCFGSITARYLS